MELVNKIVFYLSVLCLIIIFFINIKALASSENITNFKVDPAYIEIGAFFDGAQVLVSAEIAECEGVIIELEGKRQDITLNKKGEKAFLWLNVAQLTVKDAPSVYIIASTHKFDEICSAEELEAELIGYGALKKKIKFHSDQPLTGHEFDEFIKLKEHSGSYSINGKVKITPFTDHRQKVTTTLNIPSFIHAGNYEIFLYCFKNGNLFDEASSDLIIEEVGLTLLTKKLAFGKPAIYGMSAIIIALAAGLIIGVIFSKKSAVRH